MGSMDGKRQTHDAKFKIINGMSPSKVRTTLDRWKNLYSGDYFRALSFVGKFIGRIDTWFDAFLRAKALVLAKVGLTHYVIEKYKEELKSLPLTSIWIALAASEFGKRKEFTLVSQKQGFLNDHLRELYDLIFSKEPNGVRYIAYILPVKEVFVSTPLEHIKEIKAIWESWLPVLAITLESQWKTGVWKSARRSMRVIPGRHHQRCGKCDSCAKHEPIDSGVSYGYCPNMKIVNRSGVNSTLYNVVADAWQNGARLCA